MSDVESELLRLKAQLRIGSDKAVAELLGMSDKALNARKKRGKSLKDKLLALAADRPDLGLDVDKILLGDDGAYSVVRSGQLVQVMAHFQWAPTELAAKLGMDRQRAATFCESLGSSAGIKLRNAEMEMLVKEFRVRREYLVQGVEPMLGDAADEVAKLLSRMQRLEHQVASMAASIHNMAKSNAAFQDALMQKLGRASGPKYRPKPAGPDQPSVHEPTTTYSKKAKKPQEAA